MSFSLKRAFFVGATVIALTALTGCGNDDAATTTSTAASDDAPDREADGPACTYEADGSEAAKDAELPPDKAVFTGEATATIETSAGQLTASLDGENAPCTVNSFVSLADQGYFDDTTCHRLTTEGIFVLQCGDPSATGSGGPGYAYPDELTGDESYPAGTLAMANAGPNTNGSQFFIVYGDTDLPPSYSVFGTVDADSVAAVVGVAEAGTDNSFGQGDGAPVTPVDIAKVTVG
ncbi:MAG: peptidylprolyl isomerase [Nocardioides sp.]|nr:peptidylprolyl isomerase [Nocardioides sp.]